MSKSEFNTMPRRRVEDDMDVDNAHSRQNTENILLALEKIYQDEMGEFSSDESEYGSDSEDSDDSSEGRGSAELEERRGEVSESDAKELAGKPKGSKEELRSARDESGIGNDGGMEEAASSKVMPAGKVRDGPGQNTSNPNPEEGKQPLQTPLHSTLSTSKATFMKSFLEETSVWYVAWKDIFESCENSQSSRTDNSIERNAADTRPGLPPIPKNWNVQFVAGNSASFDFTKLSKALQALHGSMARIASAGDITPKGQSRAEYDRMKRAQRKAVIEVAAKYLKDTKEFDERVKNSLKPHQIAPLVSKQKAWRELQKVKLSVSQDIIQSLDTASKEAALKQIENLTQETVLDSTTKSIAKKKDHGPSGGNIGFAKLRASNLALFDVVRFFVAAHDFEEQVEDDGDEWAAKSVLFRLHSREASEVSKRAVALKILDSLPNDKRCEADKSIKTKSQEYLTQWKDDAPKRTFTDSWISNNFCDIKQKALVALAIEHVTDMTKYRADVANELRIKELERGDKSKAHGTRLQIRAEYDTALKIFDEFPTNERQEWLERSDGLALVVMEETIRKEEEESTFSRRRYIDSILAVKNTRGMNDVQNTAKTSTNKKASQTRRSTRKVQQSMSDEDSEESDHDDGDQESQQEDYRARDGDDDVSSTNYVSESESESSSDIEDTDEDDVELPVAKRPKTTPSGSLSSKAPAQPVKPAFGKLLARPSHSPLPRSWKR